MLWKSIYGLKQAYWSWNISFNEVIMESDFIQNKDEPSATKKVSGSIVVFHILYMYVTYKNWNNIPRLQSGNLVVQTVLHERPWRSILYSGNKNL